MLQHLPDTPVIIESIEVLRTSHCWLIRTRSTDGAEGIAVPTPRIEYLYPMLQQQVAPFFIGKDARDLEELVDGPYTYQSNYKLAGIAFWCCVGWIEFSLLDMLGNISGKPIGELFGKRIHEEVPIYLSSLRRDTTPEEEVEWVGRRIAETGATAVKLKIGGRMSKNADASPGRTERLVALARETYGEKCTIYLDANGSYDAARAIEIGQILEDHNIAFFEEPCPWEDYSDTQKVTAALDMDVAGGEQDSSSYRFREMIQNRVVNIVQPDLNYNGGFIRTIRVAEMAAAEGMLCTPHSPQTGPAEAYVLHFASCTSNIGPYHEFHAVPTPPADWYEPAMEVENGVLNVPTGPGFGVTISTDVLKSATIV